MHVIERFLSPDVTYRRCANPECQRWVPVTKPTNARFCCVTCGERARYLLRNPASSRGVSPPTWVGAVDLRSPDQMPNGYVGGKPNAGNCWRAVPLDDLSPEQKGA